MDPEAPPASATDPYAHLQLVANPDGSYTRLLQPPTVPPTAPSDTTSPVLTKDVAVNEANSTWFRIFLPRSDPPPERKLPIIFYFHGGGFILFSPATDFCHHLCARMAASTPAVVVSVKYRLAPEHRLPEAYEDAVEAVNKLRDCVAADEWLASYADSERIFLAGSSAGANIAYRVGLQLSTAAISGHLEPLKIKGLILHHAFFGGVARTPSELRLVNDHVLPLCVTDLMWELSLPPGADRDHPYCNPMSNADDLAKLENFKKMGWEVLVAATDGDPLYDGQRALEALLVRSGVKVSCALSSGDSHGIEVFDPMKAEVLLREIKCFVGQ